MSKLKFLFALGTLPGVAVGLYVSQFYTQNPVTGRWVFLPIDRKLERDLTRRVLKTWGNKLVLRHSSVSPESPMFQSVQEVLQKLKEAYFIELPGKLKLLSTEEEFLYLLPTGDVFVSTGRVRGLSQNQIANAIAHEIGHLHWRHSQESITYTKPIALLAAYSARHNHHTTELLKSYLLEPPYNSTQEKEAQEFAKELLTKAGYAFQETMCLSSLK